MALKLLLESEVAQDASETYTYDDTQTYVDDPDGGWGTTEGGNVDRADRALLFYTEFIDEDGTTTYLDMKDQLIGSETKYSVAPGVGLSNTDKSKFTTITPKDGHHLFHVIPVEQYTTVQAGNLTPSQYDLYYNTDTDVLHIYIDGAFTPLTASHLPNLKSASSIKICELLLDIRNTQKLAKKIFDGVDAELDINKESLESWLPVWDFETRKNSSLMAFADGNKSTARESLRTLDQK